jgi:hypothetical protein
VGYFCEQLDVWDLFSQNKQALIKPGIWRKKKVLCTAAHRLKVEETGPRHGHYPKSRQEVAETRREAVGIEKRECITNSEMSNENEVELLGIYLKKYHNTLEIPAHR